MNLSDLLLLAQARDLVETGEARQLRVSAGLTQQQSADYCGVTATAVSHWEAGVRAPRGLPALRWAKLLDQLKSRPRQATPA